MGPQKVNKQNYNKGQLLDSDDNCSGEDTGNNSGNTLESLIKVFKIEQFPEGVLGYSSKYNNCKSISYAPENLIGKPARYPNYGDFADTYMLRSYGKWWNESEAAQSNYMPKDIDPIVSEDYVILRFEISVIPTHVTIYETYNPGAVVRIWGRNTGFEWKLLWEGPPQRCEASARTFSPPIKQIANTINELRLEFNQSLLDYYTSLDSILLVGYAPKSELQMEVVKKGLNKCNIEEEEENASIDEVPDDGKADLFSNIPHEILVHIFKNLDLQSLCRCSRVCKRWFEASLDTSLYHCLSLKRYWHKVDDNTFQYLMNRCRNLKKLDVSWCGYDKRITEETFLEFLRSCCKNLTHLSAGYCDFLQNVSIEGISTYSKLTDLRLRNCHCDPWQYSSLAHLKSLVALDLYSSNINDDALIAILQSNKNLKHLIVDFCEHLERIDEVTETVSIYNRRLITWSSWKTQYMTSRGVKSLARCSQLRELDLGWCLILSEPGECLEQIATGCKDLRRLIISGWRGVTDHLLLPVLRSCKQLTQLDLLGIRNITGDICERALETLPKLQLLEVSFCDKIHLEQVQMWRMQYPQIKIQRSCEFVSNDYWI